MCMTTANVRHYCTTGMSIPCPLCLRDCACAIVPGVFDLACLAVDFGLCYRPVILPVFCLPWLRAGSNLPVCFPLYFSQCILTQHTAAPPPSNPRPFPTHPTPPPTTPYTHSRHSLSSISHRSFLITFPTCVLSLTRSTCSLGYVRASLGYARLPRSASLRLAPPRSASHPSSASRAASSYCR